MVIGAVVAALIGGGLYANFQREQAYATGHAAYLDGDCASAMGPLSEAADGGSNDDELVLSARAELEECQALVAAADFDTQGEPARAVLAYSEIVTLYPRSPLKDIALTDGTRLLASGSAERLAVVDLCRALDTLEAQRFVSATSESLPRLLLACGGAFESDAAHQEALAVYERFRSDYPDHSLREQADEAYVRATLAETATTGAGALPDPDAIGPSGLDGGLVTVEIRNDSPEAMTILFSGPTSRIEELPGCTECETFSALGPRGCPDLGPIGTYTLEPGTYDVVVKASSSATVTPFRGSWTLQEGQAYGQCFYIVNR